MYIWLTEMVKLVAMVPAETSNPPSMTTSWNPKRLVITEERGPEEPLRTDFHFIVSFWTLATICTLFGFVRCHQLNLISCTHHWRSWQTRRWKWSRRPDCWSPRTPPSGPGGRCRSSWWCRRWKPPPGKRPQPPPIPSLHQGPLCTHSAPRSVAPWLHTVPCPVKRNYVFNEWLIAIVTDVKCIQPNNKHYKSVLCNQWLLLSIREMPC